jgi:hypothetical protein
VIDWELRAYSRTMTMYLVKTKLSKGRGIVSEDAGRFDVRAFLPDDTKPTDNGKARTIAH